MSLNHRLKIYKWSYLDINLYHLQINGEIDWFYYTIRENKEIENNYRIKGVTDRELER